MAGETPPKNSSENPGKTGWENMAPREEKDAEYYRAHPGEINQLVAAVIKLRGYDTLKDVKNNPKYHYDHDMRTHVDENGYPLDWAHLTGYLKKNPDKIDAIVEEYNSLGGGISVPEGEAATGEPADEGDGGAEEGATPRAPEETPAEEPVEEDKPADEGDGSAEEGATPRAPEDAPEAPAEEPTDEAESEGEDDGAEAAETEMTHEQLVHECDLYCGADIYDVATKLGHDLHDNLDEYRSLPDEDIKAILAELQASYKKGETTWPNPITSEDEPEDDSESADKEVAPAPAPAPEGGDGSEGTPAGEGDGESAEGADDDTGEKPTEEAEGGEGDGTGEGDGGEDAGGDDTGEGEGGAGGAGEGAGEGTGEGTSEDEESHEEERRVGLFRRMGRAAMNTLRNLDARRILLGGTALGGVLAILMSLGIFRDRSVDTTDAEETIRALNDARNRAVTEMYTEGNPNPLGAAPSAEEVAGDTDDGGFGASEAVDDTSEAADTGAEAHEGAWGIIDGYGKEGLWESENKARPEDFGNASEIGEHLGTNNTENPNDTLDMMLHVAENESEAFADYVFSMPDQFRPTALRGIRSHDAMEAAIEALSPEDYDTAWDEFLHVMNPENGFVRAEKDRLDDDYSEGWIHKINPAGENVHGNMKLVLHGVHYNNLPVYRIIFMDGETEVGSFHVKANTDASAGPIGDMHVPHKGEKRRTPTPTEETTEEETTEEETTEEETTEEETTEEETTEEETTEEETTEEETTEEETTEEETTEEETTEEETTEEETTEEETTEEETTEEETTEEETPSDAKDPNEIEENMQTHDESTNRVEQAEAGPITENPAGENGRYNSDQGTFGDLTPAEDAGDNDHDHVAGGGNTQVGPQNPDLGSGHDTDGDPDHQETVHEVTENANQSQSGDQNLAEGEDPAARAAAEAAAREAAAREAATNREQEAGQEAAAAEADAAEAAAQAAAEEAAAQARSEGASEQEVEVAAQEAAEEAAAADAAARQAAAAEGFDADNPENIEY